jgi:hypothetical protein
MPTRTPSIFDAVRETAVGKAVMSFVESAVEYMTPANKKAAGPQPATRRQRTQAASPRRRKATATKRKGGAKSTAAARAKRQPG